MTSPYPWHYTVRWPYYYHWPSVKNYSKMPPMPSEFHFENSDEQHNLRLLATGDIMILNQDKIPKLHPDLSKLIQQADLFIANCEAPVGSQAPNPASRYRFDFHMPNAFLDGIVQQAGLPSKQWVLTNANNHSFDKGYDACLDSYALLEKSGIQAVGRHSSHDLPLEIVEYGTSRIGFVGWTHWMNNEISDKEPGVNRAHHIVGHPWAKIKKALNLNLLIALPHWEYEFQHYPKAQTRGFAKYLIENLGFDLILGSHPHTLQPMEWFEGGICQYSLGNFCGLGVAWPVKLITLMEINFNTLLNKIASYKLHLFYQSHENEEISIIPLREAPFSKRMQLKKRFGELFLTPEAPKEHCTKIKYPSECALSACSQC